MLDETHWVVRPSFSKVCVLLLALQSNPSGMYVYCWVILVDRHGIIALCSQQRLPRREAERKPPARAGLGKRRCCRLGRAFAVRDGWHRFGGRFHLKLPQARALLTTHLKSVTSALLPRSFALFKIATALFSCVCALFTKNTRGGGGGPHPLEAKSSARGAWPVRKWGYHPVGGNRRSMR